MPASRVFGLTAVPLEEKKFTQSVRLYQRPRHYQKPRTLTCSNCSTNTIGPYCHQCGQKTENARYTTKALIRELFYSLVDVEKGLPYTILALTMKPGKAIHEVIRGRRSSLYSPFKYLLLAGALVIIFSLRYRFFNNEYTQVTANENWTFLPLDGQAFLEEFFKFAEDTATMLNIISIPLFAFLSFAWLSGRKYNYAENLVLNTFITAQQLFFLLLFIPAYEFGAGHKTLIIGLYTLSVLAYNVVVYVQFFGSSISAITKAVAVVAVGYLCQFPLNFILFFGYEKYIRDYLEWMHLTQNF